MNRFCYILFLLLVISCNNKKVKENLSQKVSKNFSEKENEESLITYFDFKDTLYLDENASGVIKYNLNLDSLSESDIEKRYTFLYISTDKEALNLEAIKNLKHDIFIDTVGNGTFYFEAEFTKVGNNLLNGVIEDLVFLKELTREGKVKIISNKTSISKNVFVVDE